MLRKTGERKRFTVLLDGFCVAQFDDIEKVRSYVARRPHCRYVVYDGRKAILLASEWRA
jgi:hypothetical protein